MSILNSTTRAQIKARGLLHYLFNATNSKCNMVSKEIRSSGWSAAPNLSLEVCAHRFCVPKYAAELGIDPQADFTNRLESQGLLGSVVLCHPSGASRLLDRHTP